MTALTHETRCTEGPGGRLRMTVLSPRHAVSPLPGILWIHGGGYTMGMPEMVYFSKGRDIARRYGAVVVSPAYRLAPKAVYPAAAEDCYAALSYMYTHAEALGIDRKNIIVGGESAGGGLAAAVCIMARDRGEVPVRLQLPLYPMLDCRDTDSSRDNHGLVWNTKRNRRGWRLYLGELYGRDDIPPYASPAHCGDYSGLPPCFTIVCEGEPFRDETVAYVAALKNAGVRANVSLYRGRLHAFDLFLPFTKQGRRAKKEVLAAYAAEMGND